MGINQLIGIVTANVDVLTVEEQTVLIVMKREVGKEGKKNNSNYFRNHFLYCRKIHILAK